MIYKLTHKHARKLDEETKALAILRGHEILDSQLGTLLEKYKNDPLSVSEFPSGKKAQLKVYCPKHHKQDKSDAVWTTYANYKRCGTGLNCCGKQRVSQKLQGRTFSDQTRAKMSEAATAFQATQPRAERPRDRKVYDDWRKQGLAAANYHCEITGLRPEKNACHHLYSSSIFKSIQFNEKNCVLLDHEIHAVFHKIYGFRLPVTMFAFLCFLDDLIIDSTFRQQILSVSNPRKSQDLTSPEQPISSRPVETSTVGSETKSDDSLAVDRFTKLRERMVEIESILLEALTDEEKQLAENAKARFLAMDEISRKNWS